MPYVAVAAFGARIIDRAGALPTALWGFALTIPPVIAYGILDDPNLLVVIAVIEGVANALSIPAVQAAMVDSVAVGEVGTGQGIAGAAGLAAAGGAAVIAAPIYDSAGETWTFVGTAVVMVLVAGLAIWLGSRVTPLDRGAGSGAAVLPRTPG